MSRETFPDAGPSAGPAANTITRSPCAHLVPGPYPFESVFVLDDHLGPTDWLVRCSCCGAAYLLEMLDWEGARRLYRLRAPDSAAVVGLVRDLERGSCDLDRARAQAQHFSLGSRALPVLVLLDPGAGRLLSVLEAPADIPGDNWRALPCDGSWIRRFG